MDAADARRRRQAMGWRRNAVWQFARSRAVEHVSLLSRICGRLSEHNRLAGQRAPQPPTRREHPSFRDPSDDAWHAIADTADGRQSAGRALAEPGGAEAVAHRRASTRAA